MQTWFIDTDILKETGEQENGPDLYLSVHRRPKAVLHPHRKLRHDNHSPIRMACPSVKDEVLMCHTFDKTMKAYTRFKDK